MDAKLVVVGGEAQTGEYQLTLPTVVGRSRKADLKLGHPLVSRQHCELYEADGVLMVRDLGSLNGTFVGEARISDETPLEPGDLLTIGSVTFRAVYGPAELATAGSGTLDAVVAGLEKSPERNASAGKVRTPENLAPAEKPAEIEQTHQAGGLAALEQLRGQGTNEDELAAAPVEPIEDLDFGWLDDPDSAGEPEGAASQESGHAPDAAAEDADILNLEELEMEDPGSDVRLAEDAQPANETPAQPQADETTTLRFGEEDTDEVPRAKSAKPAPQPADEDEDDLDDFFKSLE